MNLYYTSGKCASYMRKDVFQQPLNVDVLYVPKELIDHDFMGMLLLSNPPWRLMVLEPGQVAPHTCFMLLNQSCDVDNYKA